MDDAALRFLAKEVRREAAVSQDKFATLIGTTKTSVQNWESGRGRPRPDSLDKMLAVARTPDLRAQIVRARKEYQYHRHQPERQSIDISPYLSQDDLDALENYRKKRGISLARYCAELVTSSIHPAEKQDKVHRDERAKRA